MSSGLKRSGTYVVGLLVGVVALVAAGCGDPAAAACTGVEYEGVGSPAYVVASDLPLQGALRDTSLQINDAIRAELRARHFRAGRYTIGFQACDDATAKAGRWDPGRCSQNANTYADDDRTIGVIGTYNSGCAAIIIPVLNRAPGGGIAMISPANTYPCLTVNLPGACDATEPDKYYPSGDRNYVRVAPTDDYQGAALARFMREQGVSRLYLLHDTEAYGVGVATTTRKAAEHVGIEVVGFDAWDPKAPSYRPLFEKVRATGADAVFLGGMIDENGAQVIRDKVAVLGPNDGKVQLYASDAFATQQTIDGSGPASRGMFLSVAGVPADQFRGAAATFAHAFAARYLKRKPLDPYAVYGAEAARVLLDAIAQSDGTRADVIDKLFATRVEHGLLGTFSFDRNGDLRGVHGAVADFTIYVAGRRLEPVKVISPDPATVAAAGAP